MRINETPMSSMNSAMNPSPEPKRAPSCASEGVTIRIEEASKRLMILTDRVKGTACRLFGSVPEECSEPEDRERLHNDGTFGAAERALDTLFDELDRLQEVADRLGCA